MPPLIDLTGQCFGRLVVIRRVSNSKWGHLRWLCLCDCNLQKIIYGNSLRNGNAKSCGCLIKKHGHCGNDKQSRTYESWCHMIQRCTNPNHKYYNNYGGRGITVCKLWRYSFDNFLNNMGKRPLGTQLDRIKNDKGYCKENCRWVTSKINNRNRRNNHLITHKGKTQCIASWSEEVGIKPATISWRLGRGWLIEKVLFTPIQEQNKRRKK